MNTNRRKPRRLSRIFQCYDPPLYFITTVTWQRQPLLDNDVVHRAFMEHAAKQSRMNIGIGRYVIMPEHLLRNSEIYSEKWEYVRMNPVRA